MRTFPVVILLALVPFALSVARAGGVWMAGGKGLTESDTTYLSPRLGVVSEDEIAEETFRFAFGSTFPISKVLIRMEDGAGKRIPSGAKNHLAGVEIRKPREREAGYAKIDYVVDARVKTDRDQIRFGLSFVGPGDLVRLDDMATKGRRIVARPVPAGAEGVLLPVANTWDEKLCHFRGELLGPLPKITDVEVSGPEDDFHVEITPDRRAFVLRGGALPAGHAMEIRIRFAAPATERGALVIGAAYN